MSTAIIDGFETYIRTELGLSQETLSVYTRDAREFLDFIGAQKLTAQSIETFLSNLRHRGRKSTTVRRKCMSVRCLCHHLISLGLLDPNTLDIVDSVRTSRRTPDALEPEAVDALVATMEKCVPVCRATNIRRNVAIVLTMYHSGLRVSELCGLNIEDINLFRREIRVKGKGGRERIVPTTPKCVEAIRAYLDSERRSNTKAVFVKSNGRRVTRRAVSDMLMSLSRRAGVKHTTAHMLRRSCATSLMNRGMELELIKTLLGHQHLATTQTYLSISHDRLKQIHQSYHPFGEKHEV
jgi:integrase/recombinase XerC